MNSILQCLSNTRELRDYCLQRLYMRDLGHTSSAHTALMEGEEPRVGVALLPFPALFYQAGLMVVFWIHSTPLFLYFSFFACCWDASQDPLFETQPYCVTLAGPKLMILLLQPPQVLGLYHV